MPQAVLLDDLQSFFTAYAGAMRERDVNAILRFMAMPLTRVTSAKQSVLEDEEAAEDSIERLIEQLEGSGIANARLATLELGVVTDEAVDVNVHWELLNDKDEPIVGYDVGYSLVPTGDHKWRIATITEDEQNRAFAEAGVGEKNAA